MQTIDSPSIVIFDEFEKIYKREEQDRLLTLFDGVYPSKKLFVVTSNDQLKVTPYIKNRPGRMYYNFTYEAVDRTTVIEVVADRLNDQSRAEEILRYTQIFTFVNFDMLVAIIEEMNRYNESLQSAVDVLNIHAEVSPFDQYDGFIEVVDGEEHIIDRDVNFNIHDYNRHLDTGDIFRIITKNNPAFSGMCIYDEGTPDEVDIGGKTIQIKHDEILAFDSTNLVNFDPKRGQFEYENSFANGVLVKYIIRKRKLQNYSMENRLLRDAV